MTLDSTTRPRRSSATSRTLCTVMPRSASMRSATAANSRPAAVTCTRRVVRSNSRTPSSVSSRLTARVSAGWEIRSRAAAATKLPYSTNARTASSWRALKSGSAARCTMNDSSADRLWCLWWLAFDQPARAHRASSCRQHALAVAFAQDRHHPLAETLGLLVVQVAREAEGVASEIDEILQGLGALLGGADDGDACARPHLGDARPQVALDDLALGRELAHPPV